MFIMLKILFLLGDTVIVKINGDLRIAVIKEIIRGKSKLNRATPEELAQLSCLEIAIDQQTKARDRFFEAHK